MRVILVTVLMLFIGWNISSIIVDAVTRRKAGGSQ